MANTKLTRDEKDIFKGMKEDYPHVKFADNGENLVCAYFVQGDNVRFAFAVTSPDEQKFRRKVGQYLAMQRVLPDWENQSTILPDYVFFGLLETFDLVEDSSKPWYLP